MTTQAGSLRTPLFKKLGLKPEVSCLFQNVTENFNDLIGPIINELTILHEAENNQADFIIHFCKSKTELETSLSLSQPSLKKNGMLWVCWPKGASKIPTDLNRDYIRSYILNIGLVDVKVAAIDENWSGLKFVYRLKDR